MSNYTHNLPAVVIREPVMFPYMQLNFDVIDPLAQMAAGEAMRRDSRVFVVLQKRPEKEEITPADIYEAGTIAVIKQIMRMPGSIRLILQGVARGIVHEYTQTTPFFECEVTEIDETYAEYSKTEEAYCRVIKKEAGGVFCR